MHARTSRTVAIAAFATVLASSFVFAASVLASPAAESRANGQRVVLTFTKWLTITPADTNPIMEGFVGGDVVGKFAGQVLFDQTTDLVAKLGPLAGGDIERIEAVYEVQAGDRSFQAFVQGGENSQTHKALLEGVILGGWHTGAKVHVAFHDVPKCGQPNALGDTCFTGTITLTPDPEN
jgi:hypothetical protein